MKDEGVTLTKKWPFWSLPRVPSMPINAAGVILETMGGITHETMLAMLFADMR